MTGGDDKRRGSADRQAYLAALCRTVPYHVTEAVLLSPDKGAVADQQWAGTVLYADLVGFTALSERIEPGDTSLTHGELLNARSAVFEIVHALKAGRSQAQGAGDAGAVEHAEALEQKLTRLETLLSEAEETLFDERSMEELSPTEKLQRLDRLANGIDREALKKVFSDVHYDLLHNTVEDSASGSLTCRSGMRDQIDEQHKTDLVFGGGEWVDLGHRSLLINQYFCEVSIWILSNEKHCFSSCFDIDLNGLRDRLFSHFNY